MIFEIQETVTYRVEAESLEDAKQTFLNAESTDPYYDSTISRTIAPLHEDGDLLDGQGEEF